jgi:hypothetical protein
VNGDIFDFALKKENARNLSRALVDFIYKLSADESRSVN